MGRQSRARRDSRLAHETMPPGAPRVDSPWRRGRTGALLGAGVGCVALAFGAVRIVLSLASGQRIRFDDVGSGILFYVASFVLAGAAMGLLWPVKRTRAGRVALGVIGAGITTLVMMRGFIGPLTRRDGSHWFAAIVLALFLGAFISRRIEH